MAVTWNVVALDATKTVGSLSDVVSAVHYTATDSETTGSGDDVVIHAGTVNGVVGLAAADASSFTAYADITKDNAIAWAKAVLGADKVTAIETAVTAQITESKTPTEISGVPW